MIPANLGREAARFGLAGAAATALHALFAAGLIGFGGVNPAPANGAAFAATSVFSYAANAHWAFAAGTTRRNFARFLVTASLSALLAAAVAAIADAAGLHYLAGILAVALTVPVFTFVMHRTFTFRR